MTDQRDPPSSQVADSPPLTPPEPDQSESSSKTSRKREREVSLEPVNTPKDMDDSDAPARTEPRDAHSSAKRNKRVLGTTREETIEDETSKPCSLRSRSRSHSVSPPIGAAVSPGREIRIRVGQISQGVEDLHWQTLNASDKQYEQVAEVQAQPTLVPPPETTQEMSEDADVVITDVKDESLPKVEKQGASTNSSMDDDTKDTTEKGAADKGADDKSTDSAVPAAVASAVQTHVRSHSEGGSKRPSEERISQKSDGEESVLKNAPEPLKRPRDEEGDPNPRETKRPSPPPEARRPSPPPEKQRPSPKPKSPSSKLSPKLTGFMAYANVSPFAAVKGPNLFASGKSSPPSVFANSSSSTTLSSLASTPSELSSSPPKNLKRSGFEAFASPSSPFAAAARSKSPVLGLTSKPARAKSPPGRSNSINSNPFASYIGSTQGFVVPAQKRARADSPPESSHSSQERHSTLNVLEPNRSQSPEEDEEVRDAAFGEKLRATRDDDIDSNRSDEDSKPVLTEQEVITGEEDDRTIHQVRAKLFSLEDSQWKERGTGLIRLNVRRSGGNGARLVMRKDAVYTLLLNITLFPGMVAALADQDSRYLRFSAIENGITTHYNLRLGSSKAAQDLLAKILLNVPQA